MKKQKLIQYLHSIVAIPLFAMALPLSGAPGLPGIDATISQISMNQSSVIITPEEQIHKDQAAKIDAYFASKNSPLEGYGEEFVKQAEINDISPYLLPAIAMRESTGGIYDCTNPNAPNNDYGWFSCKKGFSSRKEAIRYISMTLGGNNKNAPHYKSKMTMKQILMMYNPPSIVYNYSNQVIKIMKTIDPTITDADLS